MGDALKTLSFYPFMRTSLDFCGVVVFNRKITCVALLIVLQKAIFDARWKH